MRTISFSSGEVVPVLGQGTRRFGEGERTLVLSPVDLAQIDVAFPAPAKKRRLQML